jgi:putative tryptophan/tyrosine transport system substrate-binding protein
MRRREFITLLGGAAAAWPRAARAQQSAMPVVGWLGVISPSAAVYLPNFKEGLADLGYVEGRNLAIEYQWAEGYVERLPTLARELVARQVTVIATGSNTPTALAAKAATTSIPIAFFITEDPVKSGLVAALNRPGGNVTGVTAQSVELTMKLVELMHDLLPDSRTVGILINPRNHGHEFAKSAQAAALRFGQRMVIGEASSDADFEDAFNTILQQHAVGLIITSDPLLATRHEQIASLAARHAIPTIFGDGNLESGGLISYGPRLPEMFRLLGNYTGKILRGAKPADLPVAQPTNIPLKISLKAAKALGLEIPPILLARADEVIE